MSHTQRYIGVAGVVVAVALLLYPPWKLEYEGGYSRIAYQYVFSPPDSSWRYQVGERSVPPQTSAVAVGMLLGELAAVVAVSGFLVWLFRTGPNDRVGTALLPGTSPVS